MQTQITAYGQGPNIKIQKTGLKVGEYTKVAPRF